DIVKIFNREVNSINNFVDFRQELIKEKTAEEEQKVDEDKEKVELQHMLEIVPDEEGIKIAALNVKYLIIDWQIYKEGKREY
ncbi:hypothetical protein Tco_1396434, partial [Tanacetum coccineum]